MKICFISNYINHHQAPFSEEMCKIPGVEYTFIQTEKIAEERLNMGWSEITPPYVLKYYEEPEKAQKLIDECEVLIFGGAENMEYLISNRLASGKLVIRYSERVYKEGRWKCITPKGLLRKYKDHTSHNKDNVCLLCAGAYTAGDFDIFKAYPGEKYTWGYFPECDYTPLEDLLSMKGDKLEILWAGRFIWWKHPEMAVQLAKSLKASNIPFHMTIVGGGEKEDLVKELIVQNNLSDSITLEGFKKPEEVRECMKKSDIFIFTSDRREGWGAVLNEAMNSACCVVASHMIGAAPSLIIHGVNGYLYKDGDADSLSNIVTMLANNPEKIRECASEAYQTITETWNAKNAAQCLMKLIDRKLNGTKKITVTSRLVPCAKAESIKETGAYKRLTTR